MKLASLANIRGNSLKYCREPNGVFPRREKAKNPELVMRESPGRQTHMQSFFITEKAQGNRIKEQILGTRNTREPGEPETRKKNI